MSARRKTNEKQQKSAKTTPAPRKLKQKKQTYKSFRLSKKLKHPRVLPSSLKITKKTVRIFQSNKKFFAKLLAVFFLLTIIFVYSFGGNTNLEAVQILLEEVVDGWAGRFAGGAAVLGLLFGGVASASSDAAAIYQTILFVLISLVTIYALRRIHADKPVSLREVFYNGAYPLVPFFLVSLVVGLQLVPFVVGSWMYATVTAVGLAAYAVEQFAWAIIFFLLTLLSLYMFTASIFGLIIVTLPNVRPIQALRSARELVHLRRWAVMRKILFLPITLLLVGLVLLLPIAIFLTPVAEFAVLLYFLSSVLFGYVYIYELYRELL